MSMPTFSSKSPTGPVQPAAQSSPGRLPGAARIVWAVELLSAPEAGLLCGSVLYPEASDRRGIH